MTTMGFSLVKYVLALLNMVFTPVIWVLILVNFLYTLVIFGVNAGKFWC